MKHNEAVNRLLAIAESHPELAEDMYATVGHIAGTMLAAENAAICLRQAVERMPDWPGMLRNCVAIEKQLEMLGAPDRASST